ncbi:class I SAM-dependent methyltransferase [Hamadaea tsunoensis]|uniref:class I SAM-dependent methyltransferase n=1 Tax=Hamadaea tsunoensis TaxID=53368 RepID=UPI000402B25F|nr:class I SAM-dependent methyltransferase [Hamadaea tsunoensis]
MTDPDGYGSHVDAETAAATGWFEPLYADAGHGRAVVPWDAGGPSPYLTEWARAAGLDGKGAPALVVGCGLGDDAAYVAGLGFSVTAFDISPTAVEQARERFPDSAVRFEVADLFDLPAAWRQAYDLVIEIFTVQALPIALRPRVTGAIASTVAPGGTLLVVQRTRPEGATVDGGPPYPVSRSELDLFLADGLRLEQLEQLPDDRGGRWRAEFRR